MSAAAKLGAQGGSVLAGYGPHRHFHSFCALFTDGHRQLDTLNGAGEAGDVVQVILPCTAVLFHCLGQRADGDLAILQEVVTEK